MTYTPKHNWEIKIRSNRTQKVPRGYYVDPENDLQLLPDLAQIEHIEKAMDHIDSGESSRLVAQWLSEKLGKPISHQGILDIWKRFRGKEPRNPRAKMMRKRRRAMIPTDKDEKEARLLRYKVTGAKRTLETRERKLAELQEKLSPTSTDPLLASQIDQAKEEDDGREVVFRPNPGPQEAFLAAPEQEVLYGGAAGGGKSYAMLADPMRYFDNPNFNGVLFRKTNDELRELISKSQSLYPKAFPGAKWQEQKSKWTFPSGAQMWLTYLDRDEDVERYQGQAFTWIGFDELGHWSTPYAWNYMRSRLRSTDPSIPLSQRACVDSGEILTSTGWKDISEVSIGDSVLSVDAHGNSLYKAVVDTHKYITDELIRINKNNLYMSMTPEHGIVYYRQDKYKTLSVNKWNTIDLSTIHVARAIKPYETVTEFTVPVGEWNSKEFASFLGWYLAEGSYNSTVRNGNYKVIITQLKQKNHVEIRGILEAGGYNVSYSKNGDFQITNKELREYVLQFGKSKQKHFPRDFLDRASTELLNIALDSYLAGDGTIISDSTRVAYTTSSQLKDDLLEIAAKLGLKAHASASWDGNPNHNIKYTISLSTGKFTSVEKNKNDAILVPYTGYVYDIEVEDTHTFFIKQKDTVWISGNSANPGGLGGQWVKKMFVDPAVPGIPFNARDLETGQDLIYPPNHAKAGQPLFQRRFIPAKLSDNPYLTHDTAYEASLLSLPKHLREQLLYGNWDIMDGAAFPEFNQHDHVVEPFIIPAGWKRFRSCDYGYSSFSAVHWYAIDPAYETLVVYRELYVTKKTGAELADMILDLEKNENILYGVLDSSVWSERGQRGPSIAEEMIQRGCRWRPSDRGKGSRTAGKNRLHELLKLKDCGTNEYNEIIYRPGIMFFNTCRQIISDLPTLPVHPDGVDDIDDKHASDHTYDSIRYGIMTRPRSTSVFDFGGQQFGSTYRPADKRFGY